MTIFESDEGNKAMTFVSLQKVCFFIDGDRLVESWEEREVFCRKLLKISRKSQVDLTL